MKSAPSSSAGATSARSAASAVEPVDPLVAKEPLRVGLRRRQHRWQVRQSGADDDDRQPRLRDLVAGGADRRDVLGRQVLHLVDEDRDALADVRGEATHVAEQLDEVDLDVTGVGAAAHGGGVDAGVPPLAQLGARGGVALGERLDDAEHVVDVVTLRVAELADRHVQRRRQRSAQALVGARLELAGPPVGPDGRRAQRVEQHGLADPAQTGEHDGPFRPASRDAFQHDVERLQLLVPSGELGRALAGAGGVGVTDRIHDRSVWVCLAISAEVRIRPDRVALARAFASRPMAVYRIL